MKRRASQKPIGATAAPEIDPDVVPDSYERESLDDEFVIEESLLSGVDLVAVEAEYGLFERVRLENVVLTGSVLRALTLRDVRVHRTDLSNAKWARARIGRAEFTDCRMTGMQFAEAELEDVTFRNCKLDYASFRLAKLASVTFDSCVFDDSDFAQASLELTRFDGCRLRRCEFAGARMTHVDLRGSELVVRSSALDLRGAIVSSEQLMDIAPALAADVGIQVAEEDDEVARPRS